MSLPSRGAWIEMWPRRPSTPFWPVAPLAGSVDRNVTRTCSNLCCNTVAPLAGSVDRNFFVALDNRVGVVAPLAGSVDRNRQAGREIVVVLGRSPRGERG